MDMNVLTGKICTKCFDRLSMLFPVRETISIEKYNRPRGQKPRMGFHIMNLLRRFRWCFSHGFLLICPDGQCFCLFDAGEGIRYLIAWRFAIASTTTVRVKTADRDTKKAAAARVITTDRAAHQRQGMRRSKLPSNRIPLVLPLLAVPAACSYLFGCGPHFLQAVDQSFLYLIRRIR
jgi:hypothetical protein